MHVVHWSTRLIFIAIISLWADLLLPYKVGTALALMAMPLAAIGFGVFMEVRNRRPKDESRPFHEFRLKMENDLALALALIGLLLCGFIGVIINYSLGIVGYPFMAFTVSVFGVGILLSQVANHAHTK
jgi:archaellum biogenesis protein FlaJ (TadC family)